ncbi:hypothetical protein N0V91_005550 [Didymella pomorum]|uniref:Uncharacterized protein n=1 Tax=Didymella pomorum TaxID=749634 RepID=A0A9W9D6M2_9PLEO|nr:hypothetical protein N0V91_005550 [Didymella pomorum]
MIVTIDDYRGTSIAKPGSRHLRDEELIDDGSKFTVANAGDLMLKLQALHRLLIHAPVEHHSRLPLDDILKAAPPRTYVDGSENVYFAVKGLSWPSKIPEAFIEAYRDVLQSRPFTNKYIYKPRSPVRLDIMRVSKALHKETADRFFNGSTLYIEAYPDLRRGVWIQSYFTRTTTIEYVARVMRMSHAAKSRVVQLELRIFPEDAASPINSFHAEQLDTSSLRRICTELPNLKTILISFEKIPNRLCLLDGRARWPNQASFYSGQRLTLAWIHAQLPREGPRIVWDMTHFRHSIDDPALLRKEVLSQPMMKESIASDGALDLARSANATQEDSQRWSEIRYIVSEAVAPRRSNIFSLG